MRIAVFVIAFTLTSGTASAYTCFTRLPQLEERMAAYQRWATPIERAADPVKAGQLGGFLLAVSDQANSTGLTCVPSSVTVRDLQAVVERHLQDVMTEQDLLPSQTCAIEVVRLILTRRFPCEPKPEAKPPAK